MKLDAKKIDRAIADLEQQFSEARKSLDALIAMVRKDHKPKKVKLIDPRTGKRIL